MSNLEIMSEAELLKIYREGVFMPKNMSDGEILQDKQFLGFSDAATKQPRMAPPMINSFVEHMYYNAGYDIAGIILKG